MARRRRRCGVNFKPQNHHHCRPRFVNRFCDRFAGSVALRRRFHPRICRLLYDNSNNNNNNNNNNDNDNSPQKCFNRPFRVIYARPSRWRRVEFQISGLTGKVYQILCVVTSSVWAYIFTYAHYCRVLYLTRGPRICNAVKNDNGNS